MLDQEIEELGILKEHVTDDDLGEDWEDVPTEFGVFAKEIDPQGIEEAIQVGVFGRVADQSRFRITDPSQ